MICRSVDEHNAFENIREFRYESGPGYAADDGHCDEDHCDVSHATAPINFPTDWNGLAL